MLYPSDPAPRLDAGAAVLVGPPRDRLLAVAGRGAVRLLNRVFVYSSVWVAGSLASLCWFAAHVLGVEAPLEVTLLVFTSALFIYNLDHVADARVQAIPDAEAQRYFKNPLVLLLLVASAIATGVLVSRAPPASQLVFAAYASLGMVYGLPVVPWLRSGRPTLLRLKEIAGIKGWIVSGVITLAAVGLPTTWVGAPADLTTYHVAVFIFVYAASNTHMFDVRDLASDLDHDVATLPSRYGVQRTKHLLMLLNLVMMAVIMWGWGGGTTQVHPEIVLSFVVSLCYIWLLSPTTPRAVYSVAIDGAWYLPAFLVGIHGVFGT